MYIYAPTCNETGHLLCSAVVCGPPACRAHVSLQGAEGQQLSAVVRELVVDAHEACVAREVAEVHRQLVLRAVHRAQVQERSHGIDLLPLVRHAAKIVVRVTGSAYGRSSEER